MTAEIKTTNSGANRDEFLTGVKALFPESFAKIDDELSQTVYVANLTIAQLLVLKVGSVDDALSVLHI